MSNYLVFSTGKLASIYNYIEIYVYEFYVIILSYQ